MPSDDDLPPVPPPGRSELGARRSVVGSDPDRWGSPPTRPPTRGPIGPARPPVPPPGGTVFTAPTPTTSPQPSPLWPQPEPPPEPPKREGLLLAGIAVLAALLVVGGLVAWRHYGADDTDVAAGAESGPMLSPSEGGEEGEADGGEADTDDDSGADPDDGNGGSDPDPADGGSATGDPPDEGTASSVEHVTCPRDVAEAICEAASFVETVQGRGFKAFPDVQVVDESAFLDRLLRDYDPDDPALAVSTEVWRSLGLIEPETDLGELARSMLEITVLGVYFTDTDELYVLGGPVVSEDGFDLLTRTTIVHELVHAHDDQWFELYREEYEDSDDEISYGFSALTEGNAVRVEEAWKAGLTAEEQAELVQLEASVLSPDEVRSLMTLPPLLLQLQISPYTDGAEFVAQLEAEGGQDAIDAAFESPPRWSEEVLHPEQYGEHELIEVAPPPVPVEIPESAVLDRSMIGEVAFRYWLGEQAAEGWGGDAAVTWETATGACTRFDAVGDSDAETAELLEGAERWVASRGAADGRVDQRIESVDGPEGRSMMRFTSCYER